ncbi:acyl-CoA dehydrogenase [Streptomyces sp. SBST2-5]|uniref:Acyl-CoA dehydrogenase n=1 Tax=Streptomyces composti TaxID=2720025 RepID=A0ABX0ZZU1_9ACTN|nr:acyl-CoA dehydrogenase family protein [Streptomyces composti]NJP49624.1 acyl-CoA dehydrogenase [Streptomyces composti]
MGIPPGPTVAEPDADRAGPSREHWLRVAREAADDLATDAAARELAGKVPFDEVSRLREAGLLTLLTPAAPDGGGAQWATACAVVREIAAADGAIGQLLAGHYFLSFSTRFLTEPQRATRLLSRSAALEWCWGGGFAHQAAPPTLTKRPGGHVLNGRQSYATGVLVADVLAVRAVRPDTGEPLAVVVDPVSDGVVAGGDAGTFGQRLAGGGSVEFDAVPVTDDDILGSLSADEDEMPPPAALVSPVGRLLSVQLRLGLAEGVLAEAREYRRTGGCSWEPGGPEHALDDPRALTVYGELTVLTRSAAALAGQALDAVRQALARGEELSYGEYAETSVLVGMAEAAAARAAQECTARALEVIGARAMSARLGFDRFWRNARTHTLYEPAADRLRDVGDYFLNGAYPPFSLPV